MKLNEIADPEVQRGTVVLDKPDDDARRPKMYQVILHNDDYTPAELVAELLKMYFNKALNDAIAIMMQAHETGSARVGVYPKDVAETKVQQSMAFAHSHEFPLLMTTEVMPD